MNKIILLTIFLWSSFFAMAQIVTIPDANFKAYLVGDTNINTNGDTEIQVSEAVAFTDSIDCNNLGINDLTGIESFTNIEYLRAFGNNLTTINLPVSTALKYVNFFNNNITSIDISICPNLIEFGAVTNNLTSVDISQNSLLEKISVGGNQITQIDLQNNPNLTALFVANNDLAELDVSNNPKLEFLSLSSNPNVDTLYIGNNDSLTYIEIANTLIRNINLDNAPNLEGFVSRSSPIEELSTLLNPKLTYIDINQCPIKKLDVSNNPALTELTIANTLISGINLSNNLLLEFFYATNCNNLKQIDLSQQPLIKTVRVDDCDSIEVFDIANGNNGIISFCIADGTPFLNCIQVDDPTYSSGATGWNKDNFSTYSTDCGYCKNIYTNVDTSLCSTQTLTSPNGTLLSSTGIYYDTLISSCNSDSTVRINLVSFNSDSLFLGTESFCAGETIDFYGQSISTTGMYTHTLSNQNGCDSILVKAFNLVSLSLTITLNSGVLEAQTGFVAYQWFKDGLEISGATNDTFTPEESGNYYYEVTENGCKSSSENITIDLGTGIKNAQINKIRIHPNPASGFVQLELGDLEATEINLTDMSGRKVKSFAPSFRLDISDIQKGIYFIEILGKEKYGRSRLIVE